MTTKVKQKEILQYTTICKKLSSNKQKFNYTQHNNH